MWWTHLHHKALTGTIARLALAATAELDLVALEIRLVLLDLDERHGDWVNDRMRGEGGGSKKEGRKRGRAAREGVRRGRLPTARTATPASPPPHLGAEAAPIGLLCCTWHAAPNLPAASEKARQARASASAARGGFELPLLQLQPLLHPHFALIQSLSGSSAAPGTAWPTSSAMEKARR